MSRDEALSKCRCLDNSKFSTLYDMTCAPSSPFPLDHTWSLCPEPCKHLPIPAFPPPVSDKMKQSQTNSCLTPLKALAESVSPLCLHTSAASDLSKWALLGVTNTRCSCGLLAPCYPHGHDALSAHSFYPSPWLLLGLFCGGSYSFHGHVLSSLCDLSN